jgi:spoIIIJ-associated protein
MALEVEATGETVGEAKWAAVRELERMRPGLDRAAVRFQVVSEGERGLLGVGFTPARVIAALDEATAAGGPEASGPIADRVRELLGRISEGLELDAAVTVREDEEAIVATLTGPDLGRAIGRHGQTIDALQYLVNAIVLRAEFPERKPVVVDAAGYRARRQATLDTLALRTAERVTSSGREVELEPMTAVERKIVHVKLKDVEGVETRSEGTEPNRYVVVAPAGESRSENGTAE